MVNEKKPGHQSVGTLMPGFFRQSSSHTAVVLLTATIYVVLVRHLGLGPLSSVSQVSITFSLLGRPLGPVRDKLGLSLDRT